MDAVTLLDRDISERFRSGYDGMSYFSLQLVQLVVERLTKHLDLVEIVRMLNCHPLSLRLATSVISCCHLSVSQYVEKWRARQLDDEYPTNMALLRSFELSFEELEKANPVAAKLLMLFLIYHARRQYDLALRAYNRSYVGRRQIMPNDYDSLVMTQYNRGRAFLMLGRLDEALQTMLKAATHFSQLIPPDSLYDHGLGRGNRAMAKTYFRILNDVGEIYLRKNEVELADQNFQRAFDGHKKYLHEMHPTTFAVRLNIGRVCMARSSFATANKIFEYIIATYTEWWGRRHSETMRALTELAESHMRHAEQKRLMGEGGDWELAMAADLWTEILSFHHEVSGSNSDAASFARSKLQQVQLLRSVAPEDAYSTYYS